MASVLKFITDGIDIENEIKRRDDLAESSRREKFIAARRIQAWFRGIVTRIHLGMLHKSATIIQCNWRGYRDRIIVDRYLIEYVHEMWKDFYNITATRIQALWRGYWSRKTILDIRKMKLWLSGVYTKNQETLRNMKKFKNDEMEHVEKIMNQEAMIWILFILFKLHHLLRTKVRPGVITRIDKTRFTVIEEMLRCLEYTLYMPKRKTECKDCQIDYKPSLVFHGTYFERCERELREFEHSLRAGNVPIFRSEPYEERERMSRKLNCALRRAKYEEKLISKLRAKDGGMKKSSQLTKTRSNSTQKLSLENECPSTNFNSEFSTIQADELYEEIRKMDCHLNRICINCPVHDLAPSPCHCDPPNC